MLGSLVVNVFILLGSNRVHSDVLNGTAELIEDLTERISFPMYDARP